MMNCLTITVVLISLGFLKIIFADTNQLPSFIKKCTKGEQFEKCISDQLDTVIQQFTKGIPEMDVPSLDPVRLDDIKILKKGLDLIFTDTQLFGLSRTKVHNFSVDFDNEVLTLNFVVNATFKAKYKIDGRILIVPIQGEGDSVIKGRNIALNIEGSLQRVKDVDGIHYKIVSPKYTYQFEKTTFKFDNLFNGNKELADTTLKFVNENWQQIMEELAPSGVEQIAKTVVRVLNKFLSKVTLPNLIEGLH